MEACSFQAHPRIHQLVEDVVEDQHEDEEYRGETDHRLEDRLVARGDGVVGHLAHAGNAEVALDEQGARDHHQRDGEHDARDDGDHGVLQHVLEQQFSRWRAEGLGGAHVVAPHLLDDDGAVEAGVVAQCHEDGGQGGYGDVAQVVPEIVDVPAPYREPAQPVVGREDDLEGDDDDEEADAHADHRAAHDQLVEPVSPVVGSHQRQGDAEQVAEDEAGQDQRQRDGNGALENGADPLAGGVRVAEVEGGQLLEVFDVAGDEGAVVAELVADLLDLLLGGVLADELVGLVRAEVDHQQEADERYPDDQRDAGDEFAQSVLQHLHAIDRPPSHPRT